MSAQAILDTAFGFLLPFLVSWLKSCTWSHPEKVLLAVTISVICGFITCIVAGTFNPADIATSIGIIYALSQTIYATYFRTTSINALLEKKRGL